MGAAFLGLHAGQDHALPEIRHPASTLECIDLESSLFQRLRKRAARPEFDVAMIPQNGEVIIHLSGSSKEEILEVAMVRSRDDQRPPRPQEGVSSTQERSWVIQMLNDLSADDQIHSSHTIEKLVGRRLRVSEYKTYVRKVRFGYLNA